MQRTYSNQFVRPGRANSESNLNTEWMTRPTVAFAYVFGIIVVKFFIQVLPIPNFTEALQWTVVNIVHAAACFVFMHYTKGSPDEFSQGDFEGDTLWEQMDGGIPWTAKKKFLFVVPIMLFLIASYASSFEPDYLVVNLVCLGLNIVPKFPQMHHVRIFGINRTSGIDDAPKMD